MTRLLVLVLCVLAACSGDPADQVLTGRIASEGALAVRAVSGDKIVSVAPIRSDGSFTLAVPTGNYRLEVLTERGIKHVVGSDRHHLVLAVCDPGAPFDFGGVGDPGMCHPDGTCDPPCDPTDPNCQPPRPCDPMSDPTCGCDAGGTCPPPPCMPGDPNCCDPATGENCPPKCEPGDPNCEPPPPCMPGDPNCEPPTPCDPTDPMCCKADGTCEPPPPCMPGDPNCEPPTPCDPGDPMCGCKADGTCEPPPPPPPCDDPMDPTTCDDPCKNDPMNCGCPAGDPNCWPEPMPCDGMKCDPGDVMTAEHVPTGFGCKVDNLRP
jgi:hypothetical protein